MARLAYKPHRPRTPRDTLTIEERELARRRAQAPRAMTDEHRRSIAEQQAVVERAKRRVRGY